MTQRLALAFLLVLVVIGITWAMLTSGPKIPDGSVLALELAGEFEELPPTDLLGQLVARGPALPTLLLQLDKAAADERIAAVLLHIRPLRLGWARAQELRDAVERLRQSGKPVIALLDVASFNATRELLIASAASEVYAVPGYLGPLAGLAGEVVFLRGLLEKLGIEAESERIGEYKSAPEMFVSRSMSGPARENADALFDGLYAQLVAQIADGRGLSEERVRALIQAAPGTAEELVEAKLADAVATRHEALERAGHADAEVVGLATYIHVDPSDLDLRDGPAIALVFGDGTIVSGHGGRGRRFAADPVEDALESAAQNDEIEAIVLRINSGGGSPLASEQLWNAVRRAGEEKPVVVSLADAAASGGYYVASAGDAIYAQPGTLTGSIGVFTLHFAYQKMYEKLDIGVERFVRGPFAGAAGGSEPMTELQRARESDFVRSMYEDFLDRVSRGRGIDVARVDGLGRGRVWLGSEALEHGLIDGLGGLHAAVDHAKRAAGIAEDVDPRRVVFPGPRGVREQLQDLMRSELRSWVLAQLLPIELPHPFAAFADAFEGRGIAYLPTWWVRFD
jgi:protease-4